MFTDSKFALANKVLGFLCLHCVCSRRRVQSIGRYMIVKKFKERRRFWKEFGSNLLKWIKTRVFGKIRFLHNIEDDSYEKVWIIIILFDVATYVH